jgi:FKBP-type peptidyl-prolyl cis-trans isomerase FklB
MDYDENLAMIRSLHLQQRSSVSSSKILPQTHPLPLGSPMRILLLISTVLIAGFHLMEGLAQQPLPPSSGVNPIKKGVPGRSGSAVRPGAANPKGTPPAVAPANPAAKQTPPTAPAATTKAAGSAPAAAATNPVTAPNPGDAAAVAKYRQQKSYAYGVDMARAIQADDMDFDLAALIQGLSDGLGKKKLSITEDEYAQLMDAITKEAEEKAIAKFERLSEENKKQGEAFLAENAKKEGIVTIANGVQYRTLKKGDGKSPKIDDNVQVHLKGMLLNGDQFFSSYSLNQPSTFPVGRVIRGLKDALLQMKIGDKWQIFIPAEHAFGKEGNTPAAPGLPGVGPNEVVIYEIELIDIVPEAQE